MDYIVDNKKDNIKNAWLGLGDISTLSIDNPFNKTRLEDIGMDILRILRNPEYLSYAAKLLLNVDLLPMQSVIIQELWTHPFPMYIASRGYGKSWLLAVYALLRCALIPRTRVVICGAAFRQSKIIFDYMEQIWANAHILHSVCSTNSGPHRDVDRCTFTINDSSATAIPIGDGQKIRGLRANTIIADEFGAIVVGNAEIYETVIAGFAAVSANPVENVRDMAAKQELAKLGVWTKSADYEYDPYKQNQAIISGTADFGFRPFADYWKRYKKIVESKGNINRLEEALGKDNVTNNFDYRDYTVIRIPYELVPPGFMDDKVVARAKATNHSAMYNMEYGACFVEDSDGFFKRTLIESCVASDSNTNRIGWPIWCASSFDAVIRGNLQGRYVFGVDPASEKDKFTIVILEIHPEHCRIVYTWSTTKQEFKSKQNKGGTKEHDFYAFCARKIRDLMKIFPCERIGMDAQGGGIAVEETLHDPIRLQDGEILIWPIIEEDKEKDTDIQSGLHILEMCQFAKSDWTAEANHSLRKAMEDKSILFPRFDTVTLELAIAMENTGTTYDTLENCILEVEELKDELCTIVLTRTGNSAQSRDRWDTPEIKTGIGKKGRLRKDRYSALLVAYMMAKQIQHAPAIITYGAVGGLRHELSGGKMSGKMYQGPDWFVQAMQDCADGFGVIKGGDNESSSNNMFGV